MGRIRADDEMPLLDVLRECWGSASLHANIFHAPPDGFRWVHCFECYSPSTPSGNRSLVLPAKGAAEMEVVCRTAQAAARGEGNPLFEVVTSIPTSSTTLTGMQTIIEQEFARRSLP